MSDKATLEAFFETNDFPTQAQFADWIDSYGNFIDDEAAQLSKVTVTEAQIKAWFTTEIPLIPAQGANTVVRILSIVAKNIFNTTAYTVPALTRLEVHETDLAGSLIANFQGTFVSSGVDVVEQTTLALPYLVMLEDVPVVAAYTGGNPTLGDGEITIHTRFSVVRF